MEKERKKEEGKTWCYAYCCKNSRSVYRFPLNRLHRDRRELSIKSRAEKIILYSSYGDYRSTQGSYNSSIFQIDLLASLKQFVTFTLLFNDFGIRKKEFIATGLASLPACPHLSALCKYDEYFNKTVDLHQPAPLNFVPRFRRHVVEQ